MFVVTALIPVCQETFLLISDQSTQNLVTVLQCLLLLWGFLFLFSLEHNKRSLDSVFTHRKLFPGQNHMYRYRCKSIPTIVTLVTHRWHWGQNKWEWSIECWFGNSARMLCAKTLSGPHCRLNSDFPGEGEKVCPLSGSLRGIPLYPVHTLCCHTAWS